MKRHSLPQFAISCCVIITAFILVYTFGVSYTQYEQTRFTNRILGKVETLINESTKTLALLNRNSDAICEEDYLFYLRQMMFQSAYIKDIAYSNNNVIECTSGAGILDDGFTIEAPDFALISGHEVNVSSALALFFYDYSALRIKKGNFSIVNELKEIDVDSNADFTWDVFYNNRDQMHFMLRSSSNEPYVALMTVSSLACGQDKNLCVQSSVNMLSFFNASTIAIGLTIWALLCAFGLLLQEKIRTHITSLEYRIRKGVKQGHFFPLFQPIVCLKSGNIIGCEVLARFKDSQGQIFPDQFIPLLSKLNLTVQFTQAIITRAITKLDSLPALNEKFKVNINLFPCDLNKANIKQFIEVAGNNPKLNVCFEIIEDENIENEQAIAAINFIRHHNIEVAIDDFGTGYANLGQLQKFTFDYLKIDRSFVMAITGENVKSTLIPSIVTLAKKLNASIVAEGVETNEQRQVLNNLNIELAQGWLFGKPMSIKELIKKLEQA